jgi:hypothetical protein
VAVSKRLSFLFLGAVFVASNFVPFSLGGPAMSCVTAHISPRAAEQAVFDFMKSHSTDVGEVVRYLQRSDFEMKGGSFHRTVNSSNSDPLWNGFGLVFLTDESNYSCPVFSAAIRLIPFSERTWISLKLAPKPGEPSGEAVVVNVEGR